MRINYKMKYGQEGLFLDLYHKGKKLGRVTVSKHYPKIFDFLGLSYERYLEGFDDLEDIFEYISESKFFNWKLFQMDQLNKINRDRNVKRKSYMTFLKWISENACDENHEKKIDLNIYDFKYINEFFPEANLEMEIRRAEYEYCKNLYIKSKFNGGDVIRKYGLEGKELGNMMTKFKIFIDNIHGKDSYENYILKTPREKIFKDFEYLLK